MNAWTDRYNPKKINEIIGQEESKKKLQMWIKSYENKTESDKEKFVLIYGDCGVGKTSIITCLLNELGYNIFTFNSSDTRNKIEIQNDIYNIIFMKKLINKPSAILVDEIDESTTENVAVNELSSYLYHNRNIKGTKMSKMKEEKKNNNGKVNDLIQYKQRRLPIIIFICNSLKNKKSKDLDKDCLIIEIKKPSNDNLKELLDRICKTENIKILSKAKAKIVENSQNDYRRLINFMQSLDSLIIDKKISLDLDDIELCDKIISKKRLNLTLEEIMSILMKNNNLTMSEVIDYYYNHKNQIVGSIYKNYDMIIDSQSMKSPFEILEKKTIVIDDLAESDLISKLTHQYQLWHLQKYTGLLSTCIPSKYLKTKHNFYLKNPYNSNQPNVQDKDNCKLSAKVKNITGQGDVYNISTILSYYLIDNPTNENYDKAIEVLREYKIDPKDIKALVKINSLTKINDYKDSLHNKIVKDLS